MANEGKPPRGPRRPSSPNKEPIPIHGSIGQPVTGPSKKPKPKGAGQRRAKTTREKILESLRNGTTRQNAAGAAGVARNTFYTWLAAEPEFRAAVEEAENAAEQAMVTSVKRQATKSWKAAAWWLERRRSADYGKRDTLAVVNALTPDGEMAQLAAQYVEMSEAELQEEIARLERANRSSEAGNGEGGFTFPETESPTANGVAVSKNGQAHA